MRDSKSMILWETIMRLTEYSPRVPAEIWARAVSNIAENAELDNEIEYPRCNEIMELCSSFDKLVYSCESASFLLKCV